MSNEDTPKFRPTWSDDTEEVLTELMQKYFGDDPKGLAAFEEFVEQLSTLLINKEGTKNKVKLRRHNA